MTVEAEVNELAELNIFADTPEGFSAHLKITDIPFGKVVKTLEDVSKRLAAGKFTPSSRFAGNGGGSARQPKAAPITEGGPPCEDCGGLTELKSGNKQGKPWKAWFCLATGGMPMNQRHTPQWIR